LSICLFVYLLSVSYYETAVVEVLYLNAAA